MKRTEIEAPVLLLFIQIMEMRWDTEAGPDRSEQSPERERARCRCRWQMRRHRRHLYNTCSCRTFKLMAVPAQKTETRPVDLCETEISRSSTINKNVPSHPRECRWANPWVGEGVHHNEFPSFYHQVVTVCRHLVMHNPRLQCASVSTGITKSVKL